MLRSMYTLSTRPYCSSMISMTVKGGDDVSWPYLFAALLSNLLHQASVGSSLELEIEVHAVYHASKHDDLAHRSEHALVSVPWTEEVSRLVFLWLACRPLVGLFASYGFLELCLGRWNLGGSRRKIVPYRSSRDGGSSRRRVRDETDRWRCWLAELHPTRVRFFSPAVVCGLGDRCSRSAIRTFGQVK